MTNEKDVPSGRIAAAMDIYHKFLAGEGPQDIGTLLMEHEQLRDLLEPLLQHHDESIASDITIGEYRVVRELGRGGMGVIYEAEQVSLGRTVALKVLPSHALADAHAVARFKRESQVAASLDHPGITKVFGNGQHDGQHWFAMELVRGVPLSALLEGVSGDPAQPALAGQLRSKLLELSPLPSESGKAVTTGASLAWDSMIGVAVDMAMQVADALACVHGAGIVHRDVKPGNLLVRPDGSVVLSDFGIARSEDAVSLTMTGDFAGTPSYASPEQLRARPDEIDHRTDIFSLGVTLYELLTLHKPFDADTVSEVRARIEQQEPRPPSRWNRGISRDLDAIVLHALQKSPDHRYESASSFADDLRRLRQGRPVQARPVAALTRTTRWCKRNPIAAGLFATFTASLIVVILMALQVQRSAADLRKSLVHFRSMKVERDIKLFRRALDRSPGPLPQHLEELQSVCKMADDVLARMPELRGVLAELRQLGRRSTSPDIAPHRLLTAHPAAKHVKRLQAHRGAIHRRLARLIADAQNFKDAVMPSDAWQAHIKEKLASIDARIAQLAKQCAKRRQYEFGDSDSEYLHDTIEDHIAELEILAVERVPELRARTEAAAQLAAESQGALDAAWADSRAIAARDEPYRGLELLPQRGLIPLGVDPRSGLLEFALQRSGVVPQRDADGELQLDAASGLVFVLVAGGVAQVGAQPSDADKPNYDRNTRENEYPVRSVELDPFFLCKHELGHAQWNRLAEGTGIYHQCSKFEGKEGFEIKPIARIRWEDANAFCRVNGMALPTESQWEFACRAGSETPWWVGADFRALRGREQIRAVGTSSGGRTAIYDLQPNSFGLYHMAGNVQEWCVDPMVDTDWKARPGDGLRSGTVDGDQRAVRGGSYNGSVSSARSAKRNTSSAMDQMNTLGVRPAIKLGKSR